MKIFKWLVSLGALAALAGCAGAGGSQPVASSNSSIQPVVPTDNLGPAPEILNEVWLNTDSPVRLADQRGKVVLIEFWTFGCYNCRNVIPSVRGWYEQYSDDGLVVVSVHYPEFDFERDIDNVAEALVDLNVPYPVAIDNDRLTWGAYDQRFWPTLYLVDKQGDIRYRHIGEGAYRETEAVILGLLAEEVVAEGD